MCVFLLMLHSLHGWIKNIKTRLPHELILCLDLATTPLPLPLSQEMFVLMWLAADSLRITCYSWQTQVSVRQNKLILLSDKSSFINIPLDDGNLIFKSPHLSLFTL